MARDKNLRPCLPLKPQEKNYKYFCVDFNLNMNEYGLYQHRLAFPLGL